MKLKYKHMNIKQLFCKHTYTLVNHFTVPSEFDIVVEAGKTPNTHLSLKRVIVSDYRCDHCGKLRRLTAKTSN